MSRSAAVRSQLAVAVQACEEKKASNISVLELEKNSGAFTDYFLMASGANPRQIQTIADSVQEKLGRQGESPAHVEGYSQAEWVLLDYVDFVVHIFSEHARAFYDLERLWRSSKRLNLRELATPRKRATAAKRKTKQPAARPRARRRAAKTARRGKKNS